jgi:hypothetical protein
MADLLPPLGLAAPECHLARHLGASFLERFLLLPSLLRLSSDRPSHTSTSTKAGNSKILRKVFTNAVSDEGNLQVGRVGVGRASGSQIATSRQ